MIILFISGAQSVENNGVSIFQPPLFLLFCSSSIEFKLEVQIEFLVSIATLLIFRLLIQGLKTFEYRELDIFFMQGFFKIVSGKAWSTAESILKVCIYSFLDIFENSYEQRRSSSVILLWFNPSRISLFSACFKLLLFLNPFFSSTAAW